MCLPLVCALVSRVQTNTMWVYFDLGVDRAIDNDDGFNFIAELHGANAAKVCVCVCVCLCVYVCVCVCSDNRCRLRRQPGGSALYPCRSLTHTHTYIHTQAHSLSPLTYMGSTEMI